MGDPNDTISDVMKLAMVQNAVRDIPALKSVVDQAAQFKARDPTNADLTFEQYLNLLKSASENFDGKHNDKQSFGNNPQRGRTNRTISYHTLDYLDVEEYNQDTGDSKFFEYQKDFDIIPYGIQNRFQKEI